MDRRIAWLVVNELPDVPEPLVVCEDLAGAEGFAREYRVEYNNPHWVQIYEIPYRPTF